MIESDVWMGNNVLVKSGTKIRDEVVIVMDEVVTKDGEPFLIIGGVPAKKIKDRFPQKIIDKLNKLSWWNMDYECRFQRLNPNIEVFIKNIERKVNICRYFKNIR